MNIKAEDFYALNYDICKIDEWEVLEDTITGADDEDGGADHTVILKHIPTNKYYRGCYTDWDMDNTDYDKETHSICGRCDLNTKLHEVKPKQKTITIYE